MYVVYVGGGLANKMFQCAFALQLFQKGYDVMIDDKSFISEFEHDKISIQLIFPNLKVSHMPKDKYHYGGGNTLFHKLMRRIPLLTGERYYIDHSHVYSKDFLDKIVKPGYIIGPFQNERYFLYAKDLVADSFRFAPFQDEKNQEISRLLAKENSVCIHVRKGDGYATWKEFQGTCPVEYYSTAVKYIKNNVSSPRFFVFTDSPEWVKMNMNWLDYELIDWNPTYGW